MQYEKEKIESDQDNGAYIFISYSHKDNDIIQRALSLLKKYGYRFWYDEGIQVGKEFAEELAVRIANCEQFLLMMSPYAANSLHVHREVHLANEYDKSILVVYLQPTKLPLALEYSIGNLQAMSAYKYDNIFQDYTIFTKKFLNLLKKTVIKSHLNDSDTAIDSLKPSKTFNNRYKIIKSLGRGGLSDVYLAQDDHTKTYVVIKQIKQDKTKDIYCRNSFFQEKNILSKLTNTSCPFVPSLIDWYQLDDNFYLIENFIYGISLEKIKNYSETMIVELGLKVSHILSLLHWHRIVHLDIKPSNIFIDNLGTVNLIDFNMSKFLDEQKNAYATGYTRYFAPPEQMQRKMTRKISSIHSESEAVGYYSDVFSLGMTLKFLLLKNFVSIRKVREESCPIRFYRADISPELEYIIERMICKNPENRYTVEKIRKVLKNYQTVPLSIKQDLRSQSEKAIAKYKEEKESKKKFAREFINSISGEVSQKGNFMSSDWELPSLLLSNDIADINRSILLDWSVQLVMSQYS